jgi:hypothetical protein
MRRIRPLVVLIVLMGVLIFPANQALAGQHLNTVAPNGLSPWYYTETWRVTGGYNAGMHSDTYNDY